MPLTTFPIGLELLNFLLVWSAFAEGSLDITAKVILSAAFVAKFVCYFVGADVVGIDKPKLRNLLLALSALINGGVIAFSVISGAWMLLVNNAILLVMLVVWYFVSEFDSSWLRRKKK